jgi:hypothetical protein
MQTPRAYARFLPTLSVGVRNPDPLGDTARNQEFYAFIGVNLVIWDGYKRVNDISRQALRDRQMESRTRVEKFDLRSEWLQLKRDLRKAEVNSETGPVRGQARRIEGTESRNRLSEQ